jgi:hypothetical protein
MEGIEDKDILYRRYVQKSTASDYRCHAWGAVYHFSPPYSHTPQILVIVYAAE